MDLGGVVNRHFQQTKNDMYQNSGYCDSRNNKQILIIDLQDTGASGTTDEKFDSNNMTFSINLYEPLLIDTLSDIYLDNFTTYDADANTGTNKAKFVVSINEFPIKSNSNNSVLFNKIVIPNEATAKNKQVFHKARKMNYICSINPRKLTKISGTITDTAGASMSGDSSDVYRVIMEFIIVARN
jgi:hypothetical protein